MRRHARHEEHGKGEQPPRNLGARRFRSRGVDVEISETEDSVSLALDGHPISVGYQDGRYHSQLANQFMTFDSVEAIVDMLLANEGRTWTLHGHVCDDTCGPGGHGPGHDHTHDHSDGDDHGHGDGGHGGHQ